MSCPEINVALFKYGKRLSNPKKKLGAGHESAQTDGQTDRQMNRQTDSRVILYSSLNFVHGRFNEGSFPFPRGDNYEIVKIRLFRTTKTWNTASLGYGILGFF